MTGAPDVRAFNAGVIQEYRATGGQLSGLMAGSPVLLLTTTGRRSGHAHTTPLTYTVQGGRILVAASNGGSPTDPQWFANLVADPVVEVELFDERFPATAVVLEGADRDEKFAHQACLQPGLADYARVAGRVIPLIALDRRTRRSHTHPARSARHDGRDRR
jgi:deazaflavin-dependent oxidoreductase (nitroreductase family)